MQKTIVKFGLISGVISAGMMCATVRFLKAGSHLGYYFGYTAIILSFLLVYFGIRSYRDNAGNGHITFGRAFSIGILITLISCLFYVVTWEIVYFNFLHGFMDGYFAHQITAVQSTHAAPDVIAAKIAEIEKSRVNYEKPLYNAALTFMEPFPVGLVITLISAAILRRKNAPLTEAVA